jgi:hypothetical protein
MINTSFVLLKILILALSVGTRRFSTPSYVDEPTTQHGKYFWNKFLKHTRNIQTRARGGDGGGGK